MSFDKVEVRVFSGPDQVQVGSNTEPDLIVMNIGPKGDAGTAATITVGTTTTLAPGSSATVANAGTSSAAVFNFGIPTGATGATGAAGANGGSSTAWRYRAKTNATSGYPTNGHLIWNNAMQVNATEILVSHLDDEGSDIELFLSFFAEGQKLFIQNRDDSSQNQIWEITGTPTVTNPNTSTAYYTFPVTLVSSQGAEFTNNHSILFGTITEVTNSVTSATTSDGTANLSVLTLGVVPSGSITLASTNSGGFVQLNGQAATDARSIAFPNASGTLALTSQLPTLGTNVATFLATPTSANLASALTDENGTGGGFVRAEGASLTTPTLVGTPVFNATAYTYGTGAAAAHRTALIADKSTIAKTARFVTDGDSITNPNIVANPTQTSWVPFAALLPNFADRTVNNVAVSGSTYTSMIARYASTVYPLRPTGGETVYLITMIGSNDGGTSAATWISALEAYWTTAKADGFTVVAITTPIHSANANTLAFADAIRKSTVPNVVIDIGGVFKNSTNDTLWLPDDLHPTATGAKLIAEAVNDQITKTNSVGQNSLIVAGNGIGIGSTFPRGQVHAVGDFSLVLGSNETANTIKTWSIGSIPYVNAATTTITGMLGGRVDSSTSILYVGRAAPSANTVCTSIQFYTAANTTTTAGTLRGSIDGNGKWIIGSTTPSSLSTFNMVESGVTIRMSQSTGTQQTSLLFGLAASNGSIATNSLSGEQVNAAPSGTGMSWATATTGNTQSVRFRLRDTGNINFTSAAIPNYTNDAAADAALISGDLYTTTAGGRTVYRKP